MLAIAAGCSNYPACRSIMLYQDLLRLTRVGEVPERSVSSVATINVHLRRREPNLSLIRAQHCGQVKIGSDARCFSANTARCEAAISNLSFILCMMASL